MDAYPYGRPPLKPEQTKRAYARFFGLDPSTLNADDLQVPHPDAWKQPQGLESTGIGQDGGFTGATTGNQGQFSPDSQDSRFGTFRDDGDFQAQKIKFGAQAPGQNSSGNDSTTNTPASPGNSQPANNTQNGNQTAATNDASNGASGTGNTFKPPVDKDGNPLPYSRKLTDLEKYYLRGAGYPDDLLDNMTIEVGASHPFLRKNLDAVTLGENKIFMRYNADKYGSTNIDDLTFLSHELAHAMQYRNGMTWRKYVGGGLLHDTNEYEKDAVTKEKEARKALQVLRLEEIRKEYGANPDGTFD